MFSLLMQLTFGLMIELIVPALGLAVLLPKFIGAVDDFFFAGLFHCVLSWRTEHGPVRLKSGLVGSGAVQPRLLLEAAWQINVEVYTLFLFSPGRFE
jgi:hypothetical protein